MKRIHRSELKGAPYNPRKIDDEAKRRLRRNLNKVGLLEPVIWNKRTGFVVGGHQRLGILDTLEGSKDYLLDVSVVDLDEKAEREQNVALNNAAMQGDYDMERLAALYRDGGINIENTGFDVAEVYRMFGESPLAKRPEQLADLSDKIRAAQQSMDRVASTVKDYNSVNFFVVLVFQDDKGTQEFIEQLGLEPNRFQDGMRILRMVKGEEE